MFLAAASLLLLSQLNGSALGLVHRRKTIMCRKTKSNSWLTSARALGVSMGDTDSSSAGLDDHNIAKRAAAVEANQFRDELKNAGLSQCHGLLHASGCRRLSDLAGLSQCQMNTLDSSDRSIISDMTTNRGRIYHHKDDIDGNNIQSFGGETEFLNEEEDFDFEVVCAKNGIFKGRLFTLDQCNHLKMMSESCAYKKNPEWIGMACKSIPEFISTTEDRFEQFFNEIYSLYPETMLKGTMRYESLNEPHLVKYNGKQKGAPLHKDTTHKSITINALLSDVGDFGGGGTYIEAIDKTIKLEQGEMLIHPGNLGHAGIDITFGVRQLLVAFLECDWKDAELTEEYCNPPL